MVKLLIGLLTLLKNIFIGFDSKSHKTKLLVKLFKTAFISPKGTISSKRLTGFLMITEAGFLIAYAVFMKLHFGKMIDDNIVSLVNSLIYGGSGLLGATIFEKKFKPMQNETKL